MISRYTFKYFNMDIIVYSGIYFSCYFVKTSAFFIRHLKATSAVPHSHLIRT